MHRFWFGLVAALLGACGSSDSAAPPKAATACLPGQDVFCRCAADSADPGGDGTQTCNADGRSFSACGPCDAPSGARCGDGTTDAGEECDDGNVTNGDGCSADCRDEGNDGCPSDYSGTASTQPTTLSNPYPQVPSRAVGSCGGDGPEIVVTITAQATGTLVVTAQGADDDVVLYAGPADCAGPEIDCANDGGASAAETLSVAVQSGDRVLVYVDSNGTPSGPVTITGVVTTSTCGAGAGTDCDTGKRGACAAGTYECDGSQLVCVGPAPAATDTCGNGVDDDCNGDLDDGCACAHDLCTTGVALGAGCSADPCLATICEPSAQGGDGEFCCAQAWDDKCVAAVQLLCKRLTCDASAGACSHPLCETGDPLSASCDIQNAPAITSCVTKICDQLPACCTDAWGDDCVAGVSGICGKTCE